MNKFWKWMETGVNEALNGYWCKKSFTQWCRDVMFLLLILPVGLLRAVLEPLHIVGVLTVVGVIIGPMLLMGF